MTLHALSLSGALLAAAIPLAAGAAPVPTIARQASAPGKPRRLRTPVPSVIIGSLMAMPRTASSGRRIARSAGEQLGNCRRGKAAALPPTAAF
jgi:hypothetical protein